MPQAQMVSRLLYRDGLMPAIASRPVVSAAAWTSARRPRSS